PVHLGYRLAVATCDLRGGGGVDRHVVADHGADAARRIAQPGHVPRRLVPDVHGVPDRDRGVSVGSRAGRARSAHPPACRAPAMSELGITTGPAAPDQARGITDPVSHYISPAPFDPYSVEVMTPAQERFYRASQWRLMWWRFRRHRVAVVSGALLLTFYAIILFCEFLAPYGLDSRHTDFIYAPPQRVHIFHNGDLALPYVSGYD